jgi:pentatricopeptide repeat protein
VFLIYHRLRDHAKLDWMLTRFGGSEFVLNVCVSAFAKLGMYNRVEAILEEMNQKGYAIHTGTAVVLSSLLLKAGRVELAQAVLKFRRTASLKKDGSRRSSGAAASA